MRKSIVIFTLVLACLIAITSISFAATVSTVSGYGPYQTGLGGEFTLLTSSDLAWVLGGYATGKSSNIYTNGTIQTFCLEGTEYIYPNTTFNVTISDRAYNGSMGSQGDAISIGTAWLYSQFATGTWEGTLAYNYTGDRISSAAQLQNAIWWLEGEEGKTYDPNNKFMKAVMDMYLNENAAKANADGAYGVGVLNLTLSDGSRCQDQLVMVPEPPVIILLGLGLIGFGLAVRRFRTDA